MGNKLRKPVFWKRKTTTRDTLTLESGITQDSLLAKRKERREQRGKEHYMQDAVKRLRVDLLQSAKKCPDDVHTFKSHDSQHLPPFHFLIRESYKSPAIDVIEFLHGISWLDKVSGKENVEGKKAGSMYPQRALELLSAACESDRHLSICASLIKAGTDIDGHSEGDGMTPLHHAAKHGSVETIKYILQNTSAVDALNARGQSSLVMACEKNQWDAAKVLFDKGADPFCVDHEENTPFSITRRYAGVPLMKHMAEKSPAVQQELEQTVPFAEVCKYGLVLLEKCYTISKLSKEEVHEAVKLACQYSNLDIIERLAKQLDDKSLIRYIEHAYMSNHIASMNQLLKCTTHRHSLPYPDISLADTCKRSDFMELTRFITKHPKDASNREEALSIAAINGNMAAVNYFIGLGVSVNIDASPGVPILVHACENGRLNLVDVLLSRGADINGGTDTPLMASCKTGNKVLVERLLLKHPDTSIRNKQRMTALDIAIINGHSSIVMDLAMRNVCPSFDHLSFNNFCRIGCSDLMGKFLKNCSNEPNADKKALEEIIRLNNEDMMKLVLGNKKVSKSQEVVSHALQSACSLGSVNMFRILLHYYNEVHSRSIINDGVPYLRLAVQKQNVNLVDFLLTQGCDAASAWDAMSAAVQSRDILQLLMNHDIPESVLQVALMTICKTSSKSTSAEYCARLVINKAKAKAGGYSIVNHSDSTGSTPLLAAALSQSSTLVQLLLNEGAEPNCHDNTNITPLFVACDLENYELASQLVYALTTDNSAGVLTDPNFPPTPQTYPNLPATKQPLWIASMHGYIDLVCLLLDMNFDPNLIDEEGISLTHKAHTAGLYEVVRLLLEGGADPCHLRNVNLQQACQLGYAERTLAIHENIPTEELCKCIEESCQSGYPETGLGLIIALTDPHVQNECYNIWKACQIDDSITNTDTLSSSVILQSREDNVLWQCFEQNDVTTIKELLAKGENPNVNDARGMPLLHASITFYRPSVFWALMESPRIDINQKDSLQRSALFHTMNCPPYIKDQQKIDVFDYLVKQGVDIAPDSFGETLLHVWRPGYSISIEQLTEHIPIDCPDHKGQTALHAAVLKNDYEKVKILLEAGSDPDKQDINGLSPSSHSNDDTKMQIILQTRGQTCQEENFAHQQQLNDDQLSVYLSGDRSTGPRSVLLAVEELYHEANQLTSEAAYVKHYETSILISRDPAFVDEMSRYCDTVKSVMTDVGIAVGEEDPLFKFTPVLSGSCSEGTKVISMDEADVVCLFSNPVWLSLNISNFESDNSSFMKLESESFFIEYPKLFNKNKHLSGPGVCMYFYSLVRKHLPLVLKRYNNIYIMDSQNILRKDTGICDIEFAWSGDVFRWQLFSLDVVPAIPVQIRQLPGQLNHHDLLHDLFIVPKNTEKSASVTFRLGFSFLEKKLFNAMPIALKQAYKLTKVLVHKCCVIDHVPAKDFVSSYMMKCKAFECFSEMTGFQEKVKACTERASFRDELKPPGKVLKWADEILIKLEENVTRHHLESFFLPGSNLVGDGYREDFRALLYVRLCRAMLHSPSENSKPWTRLAQSIANQLPPKLNPETFVGEIEMLLRIGLESTYRLNNSRGLLYYMIQNDLANGVEMLLKRQAVVDNVDGRGMTALCLAAKKKMTNSLHFLQKTCAVRAERSSVLMTDFDAEWGVGAGADIPTFVMKEQRRRVFHAFFQFRDDAFMKLWSSRDLSQHITSWDCSIAVTSSGQVLLKDGTGDEKTVVLDEGRYVTTYTHGGQLIGCLPPGQPVYARKRSEDEWVWELVVVDVKSSTESTLQHTWGGGQYNDSYLSVCGDEDGRIAVTSYVDNTLCIYSSQGARPDIINLTYTPGYSYAVCGNHEAIFIYEYGEPASVHVHTWSGRHLQRITRDQLGIPGDDWIRAVMYNEQTHSLLLATRPRYSTDRYSLCSYKTKYEYAPEEMVEERRLYYGEMAEDDADRDAVGSSIVYDNSTQ